MDNIQATTIENYHINIQIFLLAEKSYLNNAPSRHISLVLQGIHVYERMLKMGQSEMTRKPSSGITSEL